MTKKKPKRWLIPTICIGFIGLILLIAMQFAQKPDAYVSGKIVADKDIIGQAQGINIMFITLFDASRPGPPWGAMREPINIGSEALERVFYVTREKIMMMRQDAPFPESLRVKVRFDRDGQGGPDQIGDIVGEIKGIPFGTENIVIKMDKVIE